MSGDLMTMDSVHDNINTECDPKVGSNRIQIMYGN
jgi:hypothetical protein